MQVNVGVLHIPVLEFVFRLTLNGKLTIYSICHTDRGSKLFLFLEQFQHLHNLYNFNIINQHPTSHTHYLVHPFFFTHTPNSCLQLIFKINYDTACDYFKIFYFMYCIHTGTLYTSYCVRKI